MEMTVECPEPQKLKDFTQNGSVARKVLKTENFNFNHRKNAN